MVLDTPLQVWSVVIKHHNNVRRFALPLSGSTLSDTVAHEFKVAQGSELALTLPHAPVGVEEPFIVIPIDIDTIKTIIEQSPTLVFDLRVYPKASTPPITPAKDRSTSESMTPSYVVALYDYTPEEGSSAISFSEGETIRVLTRYSDEWCVGVNESNMSGYFPTNFVTVAPAPDGLSSATVKSDEGWQDPEYFEGYANLGIHLEMLKDSSRTTTYKSAIDAVVGIKDKIVLDVGCGSGILSCFCALAGAKHVYAVDASDIIHQARKVVDGNNLSDKITLIKGKLEDIELPKDLKVDVIVSEWMGTMLVCESMFSSVITARDLYLAPGGLMLPSTSDVFLVPMYMEEHVKVTLDFWDDVYGVNMNCLKDRAHKEFFSSALFDRMIKDDEVLADPVRVLHLDMLTVSDSDLDMASETFEFVIKKDGVLHGFGSWFDTGFHRSTGVDTDVITLSTSYTHKKTHWRNSTFVLKEHVKVSKGQTITGSFTIRRHLTWIRHFEVDISFNIAELGESYTQLFPLWR